MPSSIQKPGVELPRADEERERGQRDEDDRRRPARRECAVRAVDASKPEERTSDTHAVDEAREREAWRSCERFVAGMDPRGRDPRTTLLELAERAPAVGDADRYGRGMLAERLEERVAGLLGKEAAVWMPSGTMAQQIALRIHAVRTGREPRRLPPALPPRRARGARLRVAARAEGDAARRPRPAGRAPRTSRQLQRAASRPCCSSCHSATSADGCLRGTTSSRRAPRRRAQAALRSPRRRAALAVRPVLRAAARRDRSALRHRLRLLLQGPRRARGLRARRAGRRDRRGARLAGPPRRPDVLASSRSCSRPSAAWTRCCRACLSYVAHARELAAALADARRRDGRPRPAAGRDVPPATSAATPSA